MTNTTELENLNYDKLTLSEKFHDESGIVSFRLLSVHDFKQYLIIENNETDKIEIHDLKTKINLTEMNKTVNSGTVISEIKKLITANSNDVEEDIVSNLISSIEDLNKTDFRLKKKEFKEAFENGELKKQLLEINKKLEIHLKSLKDLNKLNLDCLVLSKPVTDSTDEYKIRFLYALNYNSYLLVQRLKDNELLVFNYNTEKLTITDLYDLSNSDEEDIAIQLLKSLINTSINSSGTLTPSMEEEISEISEDLIISLYDLSDEAALEDRKKEFKEAFKNAKLKNQILKLNEKLEAKASNEILDNIKYCLKNNKGKEKSIRELGDYLNRYEGIILKKETNFIYKLDKVSNSYKQITNDELLLYITGLFNENNLIHDNDLNKAVHYISERLEPVPDIISFNNCLYSMKEHKVIESEDPIFTIIECPYNYNPEAKPVYIDDFLYESLKVNKSDNDETENKIATYNKVKGVKQIIGYLFKSGNYLTALFFIVGIAGGGKSLFGNILNSIFEGKVSDIKLEDFEKNRFSTSGLENKVLNLMRESDNTVISNESKIKQLTGNEDIPIEHKGLTPSTLPKNQVPKMVFVGNNLPVFKNISEAMIERSVIIEFNVKFRNTEREDKHLEEKILGNPEEIEYLIYSSLEKLKEMEENQEDFILRVDKKRTLEIMNKHSKPLNYVVRKLILKCDEEASKTEEELDPNTPVYTNDLAKLCLMIAKEEGIEIAVNSKGMIYKNRLLEAIKEEFDLFDYIDSEGNDYNTKTKVNPKTKKKERYYPYLVKTELYDKLLKGDES